MTATRIHPGEIPLKEFLNAQTPPVSQAEAAKRMHIPAERMRDLINGKRPITPEIAILLGELTGAWRVGQSAPAHAR